MDFKNISKKNVCKFKNKIVKKQNKLPNELIREILLYSKSRKELIQEELLKKASRKRVYHFIAFDKAGDKYYFVTKNIYNPLNESFDETNDLKFNNRTEVLNYINACGYKMEEFSFNTAFIYIPQDIMIKEYLIKK